MRIFIRIYRYVFSTPSIRTVMNRASFASLTEICSAPFFLLCPLFSFPHLSYTHTHMRAGVSARIECAVRTSIGSFIPNHINFA